MRTHSKAVAAALSLCFPALAQDLLPVDGAITFAEANRRAAMPRWLSLKHGEFDTKLVHSIQNAKTDVETKQTNVC